jgi:O-antigen/teichoic acid export membrane protein
MVSSVLAVVLAWQGFSAESLAIAMIGQAAVRAAIAQRLRPVPIPLIPRLDGASDALRFGAGSTVLCVSGALGVRSPDLIVGHMLGLAMAGLYSRSSALAAQLHMLVVGAIGSIFYPAFARLRDEGEPLGPHYERVVAGYGAVVWPAMALLAALAEPVILTLYGPVWREAAPLLVWMALGELCFVMLPLHMDLPILMGQMRRVIWYNLFDTAAAAGTLIVFSYWGIEAAAIARLAYGVLWVCVYAGFMHEVAGFKWRNMLAIYLRSGLVALITVAPTLITIRFWRSAGDLQFLDLAMLGIVAVPCWLGALFLVRHPARRELTELLVHLLPKRMQARFGIAG